MHTFFLMKSIRFHHIRFWVTLLGGAALWGCAGSGSDSAATPEANAAFTASLCNDFQNGSSGNYLIENNVWNKGDVTGYKQCVDISAHASGGVQAVWEWNWPAHATTVVRAYPEVIFGHKPWLANTTAPGLLPRVVNDLKTVRADVSFTSTHTGLGNLAFDIWLTSSDIKTGNHLPIKHELMIWLDNFGMQAAGPKIDSVLINGTTWDLHQATATWAGPEPFQYWAYLPRQAIKSPASIDIQPFLNHLKTRGSITGQEWLASIELGNEIVQGTGRTVLNQLNITID
jgi:hypothetical protein